MLLISYHSYCFPSTWVISVLCFLVFFISLFFVHLDRGLCRSVLFVWLRRASAAQGSFTRRVSMETAAASVLLTRVTLSDDLVGTENDHRSSLTLKISWTHFAISPPHWLVLFFLQYGEERQLCGSVTHIAPMHSSSMQTFTHTHTYVYARIYVNIYMHTYIDIHIQTYIHTYILAN